MTPPTARFRLTVAYDGGAFHGWQRQTQPAGAPLPGSPRAEETADGRLELRTVQGELERAVRRVVREPVTLVGASRTDSGVHALAQCAAFTCTSEEGAHTGWPESRGLDALVRAINASLPDDAIVTGARRVGDGFDPIADCVAKGYSYTIHASLTRPLWDRRVVHHAWHDLDPAPMREAARALVGEHDFASFAAVHHGRSSTVRTVHACDVADLGVVEGGRRLRIDVSGNGFLYNMVRIIAGTLADVGRGRLEPGAIPGIIGARDRRAAGPTLPPEGLRLEWIRYPGDEGA